MSSTVNAGSMLAMAVVFLNISTVLVILRFLVRRLQKLALGLDDWFVLPSFLLLAAMCINMIVAVAYGRFGVTLPPRVSNGRVDPLNGYSPEIAQMEQFAYAQETIFPAQLAFAKLSVLFFYRRHLCPENLGAFHKMTKAAIVIVGVWGVAFTFAYVFQCGGNFPLIWNGPVGYEQQVCLGTGMEGTMAFTDALLDIIIMVLPIRKIMSLRLPRNKKLAVIAAFGVAGLTTAVSVVRLCLLTGLLTSLVGTGQMDDEAMQISSALYWGMFEAGTSVIVACLPTLQYLIFKALPQHVGSLYGRSYAASSGGPSPPQSVARKSLAFSEASAEEYKTPAQTPRLNYEDIKKKTAPPHPDMPSLPRSRTEGSFDDGSTLISRSTAASPRTKHFDVALKVQEMRSRSHSDATSHAV